MFRNYFVTACNNLFKNKLYTIINIVGLAIGLAACILITLYVQDETSYDKHWQNADRIYRLNKTIEFTEGTLEKGIRSSLLALPALKSYFSEEIEYGSRLLQFPGSSFQIGDETYEGFHAFVDSEFTEMFPLEVTSGSLETTLADPGSIALSEETAIRLYGNTNPVGEILTLDFFGLARDFQVTAIYRESEENTIFELPSISMIDHDRYVALGMAAWQSQMVQTIVQLSPQTSFEQFDSLVPKFIDDNVDITAMMAGPAVRPSDRVSYEFQNVSDIHLNSPFDNSRANGSSTLVIAFTIIAVLVLLIGNINFMILTTAKATQRAREVAMRKALGARRGQLITQFLGESLIVVMLSMFLALVTVELLLPVFESFVGKSLQVSYSAPETYLSLLALLIVTGITGGLYPALVLSHFRPASILKTNQTTDGNGSVALRNILVVFQFTISIALLVATAVIYSQINYSNGRDPGFNRENLMSVLNTFELGDSRETLKQQLLSLPGVSSASYSVFSPMQGGYNIIAYTPRGESIGNSSTMVPTSHIDADFFETYQIPLLAGRTFEQGRDRELTYDQQGVQTFEQDIVDINAVLNSSAARLLGFSSAEDAIGGNLGSSVEVNSARGDVVNLSIIGVVADTQFSDLRTLA
ncbi:MAG: ABC transporter permease, partial [Pseudomonadales bacterium]|nr:ABC transporter permease [Pseudomonadales bacterium]